jgi:DNA-binding HxlR family transcriptional regulator
MDSRGVGESAEVLNALRCKWAALVLRRLSEGIVRPGQLRRAISGLSTKVLYEHLRALQGCGLVRVQTFHGYPQRAEYHLTDHGWRLVRLLSACEQQGIPLPVLADVLKCRWLRDILRILREGPQRPSHLRRRLTGISSKVLAEKLQKLERLRLISREVRATRPISVWYRLSEEGTRLSAILDGEKRAHHSESIIMSAPVTSVRSHNGE